MKDELLESAVTIFSVRRKVRFGRLMRWINWGKFMFKNVCAADGLIKTAPTLVIVQFAGDFRNAYLELKNGGEENYYAQAHSVTGVANLTEGGRVVTICCVTEEAYEVELSKDLFAVGLNMRCNEVDEHLVWEAVMAWRPTHLVLRSPWHWLLNAALKNKIPTLLTIADSFSASNIIRKIRLWWMVKTWNRQGVAAVANHGRTSARHLLALGVSREKVVAWDWPHVLRPHDFHPKKHSDPNEKSWDIFYAGSINAAKGVGDLIYAARNLADARVRFKLKIAGVGEVDEFRRLAQNLEIDHLVEFLGRVTHAAIIKLMRSSDVLVVPSRHVYPEGFPMTLFEGLSVRTPIVASDHPMFAQALENKKNAMVFKEKDPMQLAHCVRQLMDDPVLYEALSLSALETWEGLQVPIEWVNLLKTWFIDEPAKFQKFISVGVDDLRC